MSVSVREKNLIGLQRKNEELREIEMRITVFQTLRLYNVRNIYQIDIPTHESKQTEYALACLKYYGDSVSECTFVRDY